MRGVERRGTSALCREARSAYVSGCAPVRAVILSADFMTLRLTTVHENALSPLGERVDRDGAFTSRSGPGEGVTHKTKLWGFFSPEKRGLRMTEAARGCSISGTSQ